MKSIYVGTCMQFQTQDIPRTSQDMNSTLILLNFKQFEVALQKFLHFYKSGGNEFSPNLEGVADFFLRPLNLSANNFAAL